MFKKNNRVKFVHHSFNLVPATLLVLWALLFSSPVLAESNNTLLLLNVATDKVGIEREDQFLMELALVLEGIEIKEVTPDSPDFAQSNMGEQIGTVRPLIEKHNAVAATWLDPVSPDLLILHMVAVSSGRALARLVEIEPASGFEADLAMAARELLGTAFLFNQTPKDKDTPVSKVVEAVRQEVAPKEELPKEKSVKLKTIDNRWNLSLYGQIEGAIVGHTGPNIQTGGAVALGYGITNEFYVRLLFGARGGYPDSGNLSGLGTYSIEPGFGLLYLFELKHISIAPVLEMQFYWSKLQADRANMTGQNFSYFGYRAVALLEICIHLNSLIHILCAGGIFTTPRREQFERASTGSITLTTPSLGWQSRLGIIFKF